MNSEQAKELFRTLNNLKKSVKQEKPKEKPGSSPTAPGTPENDVQSELPSPLPVLGTPLQKEKMKNSSPPTPDPDPGTPPGQESEKPIDQPVLIPTQPDVFQEEARTTEQHGKVPTILVPSLSDTMRQTAVESRNRNERAVATTAAFALLITVLAYLGTALLGSLVQTGSTSFISLKKGDKENSDKEKNPSFFVSTRLVVSKIKLGAYVVATKAAPRFKDEIKLDVELQPFMVGKIIGIIDEGQKLVVIEIFPRKRYIFSSQINYVTPFVYLPSKFYKIQFLLENLTQKF